MLDAGEILKLRRIVAIAEKLMAQSRTKKQNRSNTPTKSANGKRVRRTGNELAQFRKMLRSQRKKGIPVAELARRHGISTAYIYML